MIHRVYRYKGKTWKLVWESEDKELILKIYNDIKKQGYKALIDYESKK